MANIASTSKSNSAYDISLQSNWFEAQGAEFRKASEMHKKKSKKEDPIMSFLERKSENLEKLTASVEQMSRRGDTNIVNPPAPVQIQSPEQLWANCLVPPMMRMEQDVRDEFMGHVMGLAFQAIRGKWP